MSNSKITSRHKDFNIGDYHSRIKNYNQLLPLFRKIDKSQCLKSIHKHGDEYYYEINNGLITLKRRIGSNSRYGIIFLSTNKVNKTMFATKLMIKDKYNHNEIIIAEKLSNITLKDKNPHFLLVFKHLDCDKSKSTDNNIPTIIKGDDYYICVNELVSGNLKQFINEHFNNQEFILNALQQVLISILSFHFYTGGYYHNDCHYKNFLYHKIQPGGYFHYKLFGKDIYVKNMGFLFLIWDFGLARTEPVYKEQHIKDYFRIIDFFDTHHSTIMNLDNNSSRNIDKLGISKIARDILRHENTFYNEYGHSDKKFFEQLLFRFTNLYSFDYDKKHKIINKSPYVIKDF